MAYSDTNHTHKNLAGITGVALVHIALAFGLAAGLTIKYTAPDLPPPFEGTNVVTEVPLPPPPPTDTVEPTETTPSTKRAYTPPVAPPTKFDLNNGPTVALDDLTPTRTFDGIDRSLLESRIPALPPVQPAYSPTGAVPSNGPIGWVTTNDYPTRALMRGWEGDLTYALDIGANGRVEDCRVLNSSGHDILDREACRVIERRARFEPATDSSGANVAGTYRGAVSWVIPED